MEHKHEEQVKDSVHGKVMTFEGNIICIIPDPKKWFKNIESL